MSGMFAVSAKNRSILDLVYVGDTTSF